MIAIVELVSPTMPAMTMQTLDLNNLPQMPINTPDGYHELEVFKVQGGMNPMQLHDEFHFRLHNVLTGEQARQKISFDPKTNATSINVRLGLVGKAGIAGNPLPVQDTLEHLVKTLTDKLAFTEKLMDLFVMGYVEQKEYLKIRAMIQSDDGEDRQLAKTIVDKQHEKHIKF